MATAEQTPIPNLGKIEIRVDKVYGVPTVYPVCERAKLLAEIAGTKTLTNKALAFAERMGFQIVQVPQAIPCGNMREFDSVMRS